MQKYMTISYEVGDNLYLNLTNRCNCACTFCIRNHGDNAYGSDPLWLDHEPTMDEIIADLKKRDLKHYQDIVFCGFGEPTMRLDDLICVADYLHENGANCVRLNTNGLGTLEWGFNVPERLSGHIDSISISLNAGTKEEYLAVTRPRFGENAFDAMIDFARTCKQYIPKVQLTVVDVLAPSEIDAARALADSLSIPLRVRKFDGN